MSCLVNSYLLTIFSQTLCGPPLFCSCTVSLTIHPPSNLQVTLHLSIPWFHPNGANDLSFSNFESQLRSSPKFLSPLRFLKFEPSILSPVLAMMAKLNLKSTYTHLLEVFCLDQDIFSSFFGLLLFEVFFGHQRSTICFVDFLARHFEHRFRFLLKVTVTLTWSYLPFA